jgi:hypothetical protein
MKKIYILYFLFVTFIILGQTPGDIAQSFGTYPGFNGIVNTIKQQTDGKILIVENLHTITGWQAIILYV